MSRSIATVAMFTFNTIIAAHAREVIHCSFKLCHHIFEIKSFLKLFTNYYFYLTRLMTVSVDIVVSG